MIIDQFVASAEDKWRGWSGITLLLPHGYEGQGPEHSSARVERFLQLAAEDNIQVCQPSTAAQYFHLLRRQALERLADAARRVHAEEHAAPPWCELVDRRLLHHDVSRACCRIVTRRTPAAFLCAPVRSDTSCGSSARSGRPRISAIVSIEQIYPFPLTELADALHAHPAAREIVWVQEEPANMGARSFVIPRLRRIAGERPVRSIRRSASASPATGSAKAHEIEQATLLQLAFA